VLKKIKKMLSNHKGSSGSPNQQTVLIVEDNQTDQLLIRKTLERQGYNVVLAENGEEGVQKALAVKPNIIIMDCEMPVLGGVEATRTIKEIPQIANIPVIFLTSINTPKNVIDCFETDAENYLSKPVSPKLLISQIETTLEEFSAS